MKLRFPLLLISFLLLFPLTVQASMLDYPSVKLRTLDKSTARTNTIEVKVGDTVQFGSLYIKVQACRESDPLSKPESASFLQIWEIPINSEKSEWIFSGWMFASSPALSAMDHSVYDVWVLECTGGTKASVTPSKSVQIGDGETSELDDIGEDEDASIDEDGNAVESSETVTDTEEESDSEVDDSAPEAEKTIESVIEDAATADESGEINYE